MGGGGGDGGAGAGAGAFGGGGEVIFVVFDADGEVTFVVFDADGEVTFVLFDADGEVTFVVLVVFSAGGDTSRVQSAPQKLSRIQSLVTKSPPPEEYCQVPPTSFSPYASTASTLACWDLTMSKLVRFFSSEQANPLKIADAAYIAEELLRVVPSASSRPYS